MITCTEMICIFRTMPLEELKKQIARERAITALYAADRRWILEEQNQPVAEDDMVSAFPSITFGGGWRRHLILQIAREAARRRDEEYMLEQAAQYLLRSAIAAEADKERIMTRDKSRL